MSNNFEGQDPLAGFDFEPCEEVNAADAADDVGEARGTVLLKDVSSCSTASVNGLSQQLIDEMNLIVPNVLVNFADLNVSLGEAAWAFLQPSAKKALALALQDCGKTLQVNSAYRTLAQQVLLFNHNQAGRCGITRAAKPGRSNHQSGLALDVNNPLDWKPFLEKQGWKWFGANDRPHFDYVGGGTQDIRDTAVLAFQRLWNKHNLADLIKEDSIYGNEVAQRINITPIDGFGGAAVSLTATATGIRTLKLTDPRMEGEDVRALQATLVAAGFDLATDGVFGRGTEAAVKTFQKQAGLVDDGSVGAKTRQAMGLTV